MTGVTRFVRRLTPGHVGSGVQFVKMRSTSPRSAHTVESIEPGKEPQERPQDKQRQRLNGS